MNSIYPQNWQIMNWKQKKEEDPDRNSENLTEKHTLKPLNHTKTTNPRTKKKKKTTTTATKTVNNQRNQEELRRGRQKIIQGKKSLFEGSRRSLLLVGRKDLAIEETAIEECKLDLSTAWWLWCWPETVAEEAKEEEEDEEEAMLVCQNGILQRLQTLPSAPVFSLATAIIFFAGKIRPKTTNWVWVWVWFSCQKRVFCFCFLVFFVNMQRQILFLLELLREIDLDLMWKIFYQTVENDLSAYVNFF